MEQAGNDQRRFYGWWIAGALAITETLSWGILFYAFSVFLVPMQRDLGWSRVSLTGAFSLALLVSGLAAPFAGRWLDRHGPRGLMSVGSIAATLLLLLWSRVDARPVFYLVWLGLGLAMAATLYEPAFATIATWFARDRAKALLVVTVVAGFASTIFLPLANALIHAYGWRTAVVILAALLGIGTIPLHALVLRRRPEDLGLLPDGTRAGHRCEHIYETPSQATTTSFRAVGTARARSESSEGEISPFDRNDREAARQDVRRGPAPVAGPAISLQTAVHDPGFWWLTASFCLATVTTVAVSVHLVPYIEARGNSASFAALVAGSLGAFSVGGRIIVTVALRWLSQIQATAAVFGLQCLALVVLLAVRLPAGVIFFAALFGAGNGAITLARAGLIADLYGRDAYGAINGVLALFVTLARAVAPVGAGLAYSLAGGYELVFAGLLALTGGAALATIGAEHSCRVRRHPAWIDQGQGRQHAERGG